MPINLKSNERRAVRGKFSAPLFPSFLSRVIIITDCHSFRMLSTGVAFGVALPLLSRLRLPSDR